MNLRLAAAAAVLATATVIPASAQTDTLSKTSMDFYGACMAKPGSTSAECGCVTGYFAAMMKEDEFQVMTMLVPLTDATGESADGEKVAAVLLDARQKLNLDDARFEEIMGAFAALEEEGQRGDRVCLPLAGK